MISWNEMKFSNWIAQCRHKTPFAKKKVASYSNVDGNELLMNELGKNAESVYNGKIQCYKKILVFQI